MGRIVPAEVSYLESGISGIMLTLLFTLHARHADSMVKSGCLEPASTSPLGALSHANTYKMPMQSEVPRGWRPSEKFYAYMSKFWSGYSSSFEPSKFGTWTPQFQMNCHTKQRKNVLGTPSWLTISRTHLRWDAPLLAGRPIRHTYIYSFLLCYIDYVMLCSKYTWQNRQT